MSEINILLPFKEKFSKDIMSSVSISVKSNINESIYKKKIKIFGQYVNDPIYKKLFVGIKKPKLPFLSKNVHLAKKMCNHINENKLKAPIIEVHNRPYLVKLINKKVKNAKVILFFHNDPNEMKGAKYLKERLYLINNCSAICFVSKYIKNQFLSEINQRPKNLYVMYNGISRVNKDYVRKEKNIIFVGRLVEEKGVHLFVEAIKMLHKKYNNWNFIIIGSTYLGDNKIQSKFSSKVFSLIKSFGPNVKLTGYIPYQEVQSIIQKSEILVAPSIWEEPFGLVVAEGMMYGCAIITTKKGGIPEIIKNNGIVLNSINAKNLEKKIEFLIKDQKFRKKIQKAASINFTFTSSNSSKKLDDLRTRLIKI